MIEIKERPILFSSEMVRAILDDRKTETRRVMRPQPSWMIKWFLFGKSACTPKNHIEGRGIFSRFTGKGRPEKEYGAKFFKSPYGVLGDILYVRETFFFDENSGPHYRADCDEVKCGAFKWKPSIHMPRKFSRIKLKIKEIRVERVQDITELGAINEGALTVKTDLVRPGYSKLANIAKLKDEKPPLGPGPTERFKYLWDSLNKKRGFGWDKNPYVWVIKFERIK